MIATVRRLTRLSRRARESQHRISELVQATALSMDGAIVWGQFLDEPRQVNQFGIYGTAAAVEILSVAGFDENSPLIRDATSALPDASVASPQSIYDQEDLEITFKLAALLDATHADQDVLDKVVPAELQLRSHIIDGRGWGYHHGEHAKDSSPRFLPTAQVMYSLSRSRDFRTSTECEQVLSWLCRELLSDHQRPPDELALAVLVLAEFRQAQHRLPDLTLALDDGIEALARWALTRKRPVLGESRSYHYSVRSRNGQNNHYLFFPTDVLAALALIRGDNPAITRKYVLDVIRYASDNVESNGGFRARATHRIATVDQLWATRLLSVFESTANESPQHLLPRFAQMISLSRARKGLVTVLLLSTAALGTTFSALPDVPTLLKVLGAVSAALSVSLLAVAFWNWIGGN